MATGTGLIAKHIVNAAAHIEATDASAEMILEAKRDNRSAKLHFSVRDMFRLPYADKSFDVVIVSNALHIVPQPEKALAEIRRVLKDDGVLIAPTFTHRETALCRARSRLFFMKLVGFPLNSRWSSAEYLAFSAAERLDGAEERRAESVLSADLCGMCKTGGVICHSLKIPASP
ncbi:MAG: class I SAM-dependent methyltransferase [Dysosmobacter sp.]